MKKFRGTFTVMITPFSGDGLKINFDSFTLIILKFKNGIIVKITANGVSIHPHFHSLKIFGDKKGCFTKCMKRHHPELEKE